VIGTLDMVGQTVSHYHVLNKLGGGGMGVVYEAEDTRLGRRVALKFIPPDLLGDHKSLERFLREARIASQLNHPNICTIHDIGDYEGVPYIVMEKLEGSSLRDLMEQGKPMDIEKVIDVGIQVSDALAACHAKGIIHRDIKPANIFLSPTGQAKILDFGLVKVAPEFEGAALEDLTIAGEIFGTTIYMSPEQARGEELDPRSDLFSLGTVLYEMATGSKPFRKNNSVNSLNALLNERPPAPRKLNPLIPEELEAILGRAMEKDRGNRYQTALAMKGDLESLKRDTEPGLTKSARMKPVLPYKIRTSTFQTTSRWQTYTLLGLIGLLLAILIPVGAWWFKHRPGAAGPRNTIAVLPLRNLNGDVSVDFLRFALADEITNTLAYNRSLDVRPTSMTQKYSGNDVDPQQAARALHAAIILTGHFVERGENLSVTLEAVQASDNRLIWQTTFTGSAQDLIALQSGLAAQVRQGLLPLLGAGQNAQEAGSRPKNPQAYDLYLHALAIPHDPVNNKDALAVLQQVVQMDPTYAPAWVELGLRSYYDATYSDGGEAMLQQSNRAYAQALQLDPNNTTALGQQITNGVERGELGKAYESAAALVKQRPDSAQAHFALSYVFRYAGMLDKSARECNTALTLDPGNYMFRSCAWTLMELGQTERAAEFLRLDAGSEWAAYVKPSLLLRSGKVAEAKEAVKRMPTAPRYHRDLLEACLALRPAGELDRIAHDLETSQVTELDPEMLYYQGALLGYCGKSQASLQLLQSAVERNYCAYDNLVNDPLLAKLRADQAFDKVLTSASACQEVVKARMQRQDGK
jgi:serine/threonine protein kinase/tetratricopeptide (TPR) repeat protein